MKTQQSFRDYIQSGEFYQYAGKDPDPSAKRFTLAAGIATLILPWATFAIVDQDVGAVAAAEAIYTPVAIAYGSIAFFLSALVFGRGLFLVAMKAIFVALIPLGIAETLFFHFDKISSLYAEAQALTYHRLGLLLLLGTYTSFVYDLVRNGAADIISRALWRRDGFAASEKAPTAPVTDGIRTEQ